jgi:hypothetical protein
VARARSAFAQRFFLTLTDGFLAPVTSYYLATSLADWFERESSIIDIILIIISEGSMLL